MPECRHCGEELVDDEAYAEHLREAHGDQLSALDRRRIQQLSPDDDASRDWVPVAVLVLLVAILGVVAFRAIGSATSGVDARVTPDNLHSVHYHGDIEVRVEGSAIDFSESQYQRQANAFHFEGGTGDVWHVHARNVTLEYAMATLGIDVTASSVTVDGTTYRDSDPAFSVAVTVNGDPVRPERYVLQRNDRVRIDVSRTE